MRITFLALVLCGAAGAAPQSQTTTYVDGNLAGITPKTGGTLAFDDAKTMHLSTGTTTVEIPYAGVTHAELGAVQENTHQSFFKVWDRFKSHRTETQLLIVNFTDDQGQDRTMTLELERSAAQSVIAELETRTGKTFVAKEDSKAAAAKKPNPMGTVSPQARDAAWWGDDYWKTPGNADKWPKSSSGGGQN
ncbi:MAG TPA: hypothetical protein VMB85_22710 [Bryobacteraceae bacterium]|jgi:hypothetical protein|nr:hypothetical protein [Bryobacteraceae bacterium]